MKLSTAILEDIIEKAFEAGYQCKNNNGYKVNGTYQRDYNKFIASLKFKIAKKEPESGPLYYRGDNYPYTIRECPGYEGYIPRNLTHQVCKHCGTINYYH